MILIYTAPNRFEVQHIYFWNFFEYQKSSSEIIELDLFVVVVINCIDLLFITFLIK